MSISSGSSDDYDALWLGIGPMIGIEQAFFISLLGLRPGLFRCHTDLTDGTDFES